jgi:hypothetical protein
MRLGAIVLGLGLAGLLVMPGASAHVGPVDVAMDSGDEDAPTPACIPTCEVRTSRFGNLAPVTVVADGATVTWTVAEGGYHSATSDDGIEDKRATIVDGDPPIGADACLDVGIFDTASAQFRIADGHLEAQPLSEEGGWSVCEEATELDEGFLLAYHCDVHPRKQNSALLVVPST